MSEVSKTRKIYNIVSTAIVAVVFVFLVVIVSLMLVQRKSGQDSKVFGYYMYDVLTDSMSGTIEPGDVILAKAVEDKYALKEGDIITFIAPSGPFKGENITHRIVRVEWDGDKIYYCTKGDNPNVGEDNWLLSPEAVKAKYVKKAVVIGGLRRFLTHWYGYILLIALPLTVVGVLIIVGAVRDRYAKERENAEAVANMTDEQKAKLLEQLLRSKNDDGESGEGEKADDADVLKDENTDAPADLNEAGNENFSDVDVAVPDNSPKEGSDVKADN